ncbi:hypothetical protein J4Q44_G00311480 [Coregonus suidteri]|uniref:Teneurin N-terminal domain-containing protein n=1 Tax=Coregonus suidteri TaxID=861788 RepID=A0AAN8KUI9_9TELE
MAELGVCNPAPIHPSAPTYCPDMSLLQRGYSLSAGSDPDADSDPEGPLSPERAIQLWGGGTGGGTGGGPGGGQGGGVKSTHSSGLSSRENSVLTLTDSDNDYKSDHESAYLEDDEDEEDEDPYSDCIISLFNSCH